MVIIIYPIIVPTPPSPPLPAISGGKGRQDVASLLLHHHADVNLGRAHKPRALHHASAHGEEDLIRLLASHDADLMAESDSGTPLHWAAGEGAKEAVKTLIELGANVRKDGGGGRGGGRRRR